jgi:SAM-dependent methyltransferase
MLRGRRAGASRTPSDVAEPRDKREFTARYDRLYTRFAGVYDIAIRVLPVWRTWLRKALPHIEGPQVLEVSFGTGWLLTQYAGEVEAHGVDLNRRMVAIAKRNLRRAGLDAKLRRANVEDLPFDSDRFDTVVNTMAFSGYPDGASAMSELHRVLRPGGRLLIIDVAYPADGNRIGSALVGLWKRLGDVLRDLPALLAESGFDVREQEIGGSGSIHLYVATKRGPDRRSDARAGAPIGATSSSGLPSATAASSDSTPPATRRARRSTHSG